MCVCVYVCVCVCVCVCVVCGVWCVVWCVVWLTYTGILAFSRTDTLNSETDFSSDELKPTAGKGDRAQAMSQADRHGPMDRHTHSNDS